MAIPLGPEGPLSPVGPDGPLPPLGPDSPEGPLGPLGHEQSIDTTTVVAPEPEAPDGPDSTRMPGPENCSRVTRRYFVVSSSMR